MSRITAAILTLAATLATATAAPRFAVVRVTDVYRDLPSTAALQERTKQDRENLLQNPRAEQLRKALTELRDIQLKLQDSQNSGNEETRMQLMREFEIKRQETHTIQLEFETFRAAEEKEINRRMVKAMRDSLDKILALSQEMAIEEGLDGVIDSSGNSNTGVPVVLYVKDAPDLTDTVINRLKKAESAGQP